MHLYLRLVNESGDPIVEQASEAGSHSEAVGLESGGFRDISDNPDTTGKLRSIKPSLVFTNIYYTLCLVICALSN